MSNLIKLVVQGVNHRSMTKLLNIIQNNLSTRAMIVTNVTDADVHLFDADDETSKKLLENHLKHPCLKPVIVLSNQQSSYDGALPLKKPIAIKSLQDVLTQAEDMMRSIAQKPTNTASEAVTDDGFTDFFNQELFDFISTSSWEDDPIPQGAPEILRVVRAPEPQVIEPAQPEVAVPTDGSETQPDEEKNTVAETTESQTKVTGGNEATAKAPLVAIESELEPEPEPIDAAKIKAELAALEMSIYNNQAVIDSLTMDGSSHYHYAGKDEKVFFDYLNTLDDSGNTMPEDLSEASYNPNIYFQGYFQLAIASCLAKSKSAMIQSDWCPITLLPYSQEVWLEASDAEIKAFAEIRMQHKSIATQINVIPIDPKQMTLSSNTGKFQSMESFTWKLACWTSKGRYPEDLDFNRPVFLRQWPNFTRLLLTPNALQIAALLIKSPRTMLDVAQTLNINPRHVFVFISAACAIGLAGSARRLSDNLAAPPMTTHKKQISLGRFFNIIRRNG